MQEWHKSRSFLESYKFAWAGVREAYRREPNLRRQSWILVFVLLVSVVLDLPASHIAIVVLMGGVVLGLECLNSSLEQMQDLVWPEYNETIRRSKDIAAGAVLLASMAAVVVGLLIFLPPLANLLRLL